MRIGIVTITDLTNYGNRLQNYAMCRILQTGFHCDVVSLTATNEKPFSNGHYLTWVKERIARAACMFPEWAERRFGANITRWNNFIKWNKHIPTKVYYHCDHLPSTLQNAFDFFVAGSDQIWNYHFAAAQFYDYFLKFSSKDKKIAVSASFGADDIPESWQKEYQLALRDFAHISVREYAGKRIVKDLIHADVPVLIDPTMMLSKKEWLRVAKKPRVDLSKPYILKYYLGNETGSDCIDAWAEQNGYAVYALLNKEIPELYSAGPGEFISLVSKASLVCSDSFHCIVFSMIFNRPFIVYERQGQENYMASRLETLLQKFNFQNRWKHLVAEENYLMCDYTEFDTLLRREQEAFTAFLKNSLS